MKNLLNFNIRNLPHRQKTEEKKWGIDLIEKEVLNIAVAADIAADHRIVGNLSRKMHLSRFLLQLRTEGPHLLLMQTRLRGNR